MGSRNLKRLACYDSRLHYCLLNEAVTSASALLLFLQLHELQFTKWLEDILQVALGDTEMDVSYIKSVKWNRIRVAAGRFGVSSLTILFRFGKLSDDRDA